MNAGDYTFLDELERLIRAWRYRQASRAFARRFAQQRELRAAEHAGAVQS